MPSSGDHIFSMLHTCTAKNGAWAIQSNLVKLLKLPVMSMVVTCARRVNSYEHLGSVDWPAQPLAQVQD